MSLRIELETALNEGRALTNCACTLPPILVFKSCLQGSVHTYPILFSNEDLLLWFDMRSPPPWGGGLAYFSHISGENNHRKRIFSKTLSRVCLVPRRLTLVLVGECVLVSCVFSCVHATMRQYGVVFAKA